EDAQALMICHASVAKAQIATEDSLVEAHASMEVPLLAVTIFLEVAFALPRTVDRVSSGRVAAADAESDVLSQRARVWIVLVSYRAELHLPGHFRLGRVCSAVLGENLHHTAGRTGSVDRARLRAADYLDVIDSGRVDVPDARRIVQLHAIDQHLERRRSSAEVGRATHGEVGIAADSGRVIARDTAGHHVVEYLIDRRDVLFLQLLGGNDCYRRRKRAHFCRDHGASHDDAIESTRGCDHRDVR